jgi:galactose mutarotase-like enzyme
MRKLGIWLAPLLGLALIGVQPSAGNSSWSDAAKGLGAAGQAATAISIGGEPVITLMRPPFNANLGVRTPPTFHEDKPYFTEATILPGNGMNLVQLKAFLPGKGAIDVLTTKSLPDLKKYLETDNDAFGNNSFKVGGAILLPYPNRIRGKLSADGKTLETTIAGKQVWLPANWHGVNPGAEVHAMHGLIMSSKFQDVRHTNGAEDSTVSGILHAGNFGGHWLSDTDVKVQMTLKNDAMELTVTTTNAGKEPLPMAIGFHPYFEFPSGDRKQARLHIPADTRALVNNYDDVFPTGQLVPVKNTPYDFTAPDGAALGTLFMDDCFTNIKRDTTGHAVIEIVDPEAKYGVRIIGLSPEIKAIQVYAPPDKSFVAVEPQFNLADPYNKKIWGNTNTGMVMLAPGASVSWRVRLELFTPSQ